MPDFLLPSPAKRGEGGKENEVLFDCRVPFYRTKNMGFILGQKIGMSQIFDDKGNQIPVTLVEAGPCKVLQIKKKDTDGYEAVQIGFKDIKKEKNIKKTMKGKEFQFIREFKDRVPRSGTKVEKRTQSSLTDTGRVPRSGTKVGDNIDASTFQEGDIVKISGISKGKGFQGAVKRWGFKGKQSATHGNKHEHRTVGSIGTSFPERVIKGKKMPGRMGAERVTVKNLKIMKIDNENNLLVIKGAVPGRRGTLLEISNF